MHSRRWVWALHFGLVGITFATTLDDKEAPNGETVNGGILPDSPISLPPIHVPSPGFGGLDNTPALALQKRDAPEPKCGPTYGACQDGYCCSPSGFCGNSRHYCQAPDCLIDYGSGCDALRTPDGESTLSAPRDPLGKIPYANQPIFNCKVPNTVALTYDDGPNIYTSDLLDILDSFGAKATFFVTGINSNKGPIDDHNLPWRGLINRMLNKHQIASHTWAHQNLDSLSPDQLRSQLVKNEMALRNIFGGFPTYMRPPYSSCSDQSGCVQELNGLGYHVAYFDVDTDDYNNDSPYLIQASKDIFDYALASAKPYGGPLLVIAHDVHKQTVYNLTSHMLDGIYAAGYRAVTLGECLGDDPENWYRWIPSKNSQDHSVVNVV
ncbi:chitin deacetylase [Histoplasma capsulatum var. duboisii H88]|uniref:Chitin deacetylase n=1 Tax=Ajellomyces capsulatus (strain H88) TaxID=544711 RepID=A0A8A1LG35_AJEC8|nr:chitin deacetylase [Histoplasma capsulatum var. duboisii H88]